MSTVPMEVQIARLEEQMREVNWKLERATSQLNELNKLAIQGRVGIVLFVSVGTVVGWFIAQATAVKTVIGAAIR